MSITIPFIFLLHGLLRYNCRLKSLTVVGRKRQGRRSPAGFSWSPQYFMCVSSHPPCVFNEIPKNRYRFQTFQEDHVTQEISYFVTVGFFSSSFFLFLFFSFFFSFFLVFFQYSHNREEKLVPNWREFPSG